MTAAEPIHIPLAGPLHEARFVERPNRFLLRCRLPAAVDPPAVRESPTSPTSGGAEGPGSPTSGGGDVPASPTSGGAEGRGSPTSGGVEERGSRVVDVHLADPGRLNELLLPGRRVWIRWAASPTRKTDWSAVLVETPDRRGLVSVDTTMPNRLIRRALEAGALEEFDGWTLERAEFPLGRSRIDFLLTRSDPATSGRVRKLALEVKSVTLVEDGVALFPDAVTARGARHVRELSEVAATVDEDGVHWEAAILFVLQRADAVRIEAARAIDPDFADALAEAKAAGVRVFGRRCRVTRDRLELGGPVPAS